MREGEGGRTCTLPSPACLGTLALDRASLSCPRPPHVDRVFHPIHYEVRLHWCLPTPHSVCPNSRSCKRTHTTHTHTPRARSPLPHTHAAHYGRRHGHRGRKDVHQDGQRLESVSRPGDRHRPRPRTGRGPGVQGEHVCERERKRGDGSCVLRAWRGVRLAAGGVRANGLSARAPPPPPLPSPSSAISLVFFGRHGVPGSPQQPPQAD